eukprot:PhM_4_TR3619/c0_g1_i1/m.53994
MTPPTFIQLWWWLHVFVLPMATISAIDVPVLARWGDASSAALHSWILAVVTTSVFFLDAACQYTSVFGKQRALDNVPQWLVVVLWVVLDVIPIAPTELFPLDGSVRLVMLVRCLKLPSVLLQARLLFDRFDIAVTVRHYGLELQAKKVRVVTGIVVATTWLVMLRNAITNYGDREEPYYVSLSWTLATLTGQSHHGKVDTAAEYVLYVLYSAASLGIVSICVVRVFLLCEKLSPEARRRQELLYTSDMMDRIHVPQLQQGLILSFWRKYTAIESTTQQASEALRAHLPPKAGEYLQQYVVAKQIRRLHVFARLSHECRVAVAEGLKRCVYGPQDYIYRAGGDCRTLYIIDHGVILVKTKSGFQCTLQNPNVFGFDVLTPDGLSRSVASVVSVTYSSLFLLEKGTLVGLLNGHAELRTALRNRILASGLSREAGEYGDMLKRVLAVLEHDVPLQDASASTTTEETALSESMSSMGSLLEFGASGVSVGVDSDRSSSTLGMKSPTGAMPMTEEGIARLLAETQSMLSHVASTLHKTSRRAKPSGRRGTVASVASVASVPSPQQQVSSQQIQQFERTL